MHSAKIHLKKNLAPQTNGYSPISTPNDHRIHVARGPTRHQLLRKLLSALDRLGCFSFLSALASIWRIRSRVNPLDGRRLARTWAPCLRGIGRMLSRRPHHAILEPHGERRNAPRTQDQTPILELRVCAKRSTLLSRRSATQQSPARIMNKKLRSVF